MAPTYRRHFPSNWTDEEVIECVTEIVTNPKNPWKQITGKNGFLLRYFKYIVDGRYDEKDFRVIIEPEKRGILTAYQLPREADE
jgi:hypothetical protein